MAQGADRLGWDLRALTETNTWYFNRRIFVLSHALARAIPVRGSILDIGSGDGRLAQALMRLRPDLKIEAIDEAVHPRAALPVRQHEGARLPFADQSFDYAIAVDVLRFTEDPSAVLAEAARVARSAVVVKDYMCEGFAAGYRLGLLDRLGGVGGPAPLPNRQMTHDQWQGVFFKARLQAVEMGEGLDVHLPPWRWLFGSKLHFLAVLAPRPA